MQQVIEIVLLISSMLMEDLVKGFHFAFCNYLSILIYKHVEGRE